MNTEVKDPEVGPTQDVQSEAIKAITTNYDVSLFSVLPGVDSRLQYLKTNGVKLGLTKEEVEYYFELFIKSGLWAIRDNHVFTQFDLLNLEELTIQNYLNWTLAIISRLSVDGPCNYETTSLATSRELVRELMQNINRSLRQFSEKSKQSNKSVIFSWTHANAIVYENKSKLKEKNNNEDLI